MPKVYSCRPSFEDERPMIDFELADNACNDWLTVGKVFDGTLPQDVWPAEVAITIADSAATEWDGYMVAGTSGIYSRRFVDLVGQGLADFSLLPALLNDEPYFFLRCERRINCLDRHDARFETYPHDSTRIMSISHFAFTRAVPTAPELFGIPETLELLSTEALALKMLNTQTERFSAVLAVGA